MTKLTSPKWTCAFIEFQRNFILLLFDCNGCVLCVLIQIKIKVKEQKHPPFQTELNDSKCEECERKFGWLKIEQFVVEITFSQVYNLFENVVSPLLELSHSPSPGVSIEHLMQIAVHAFSQSQTDKSVLISPHIHKRHTLTEIYKRQPL